MQGLYCVDFWKRIAAFMVDLIILCFTTPLVMAIFFIFLKTPPPAKDNPMAIVLVVIFIIISWLYFAFTECSKKQASIGKRIFQLMVTDLQGNRITFYKAALRFWGKFIVFPGFLLTPLIMKNKYLNDMFVKTCVVNKYEYK
jgi:uncharacterized RDD family membrane protein YckC